MSWTDKILRSRRGAAALVALLTLFQGGCFWVAAGAAAGGLVTHAYCNGKTCHIFIADLGDALAATRAALAELGLTVEKEESGPERYFIKTRSACGERIRIHLDRQSSKIPADGPVTRVCVRVGAFGDHPLSDRILFQIGAHLVPRGSGPQPSGPPEATLAPPQNPRATAVPPRPVEPPLAPQPRPVEPPLAR